MLRKNKYRFLILLPLLVALPLLLMISLQVVQAFLKASALERLGGTKQQTFVLPKGSVQWEEEGRELRINNRFFDAVKVEEKQDRLIITGHFDDAETAVWQVLEATAKSAGGFSVNQLLLLLQCFVSLSFFSCALLHQNIGFCFCSYALQCYKNISRSITGPPPRLPL